jgi:hypothetical protein
VRGDLLVDLHVHAPDAGQRGERVGDEAPDHVVLALRGIAELDVHRHVVAVDGDLLHGLARDEVAARVRVDQRLEAALDVGVGDRHDRSF